MIVVVEGLAAALHRHAFTQTHAESTESRAQRSFFADFCPRDILALPSLTRTAFMTAHPDEISIDDTFVAHLICTQTPHWADLLLRRIASSETDNAM